MEPIEWDVVPREARGRTQAAALRLVDSDAVAKFTRP